jgi:molybdopterin-guanine dinucleotide biosynthesis protein A
VRDVAGAILAGGEGRRMGGTNKALIEIGGQRIIDRLLHVFRSCFEEVLIAAREASDFAGLGVAVAVDHFALRCSLTGIHAALAAARAPWVFVCACDTPFLRRELVLRLLAERGPDCDAVVPIRENGLIEPLCAAYSKACLPHIEALLAAGKPQVIGFFSQVRVRHAPVALLREADPELESFLNVNTPGDLAALSGRKP